MYERTGYDWGSLGVWGGSDPIPGSPEVLESVAGTYATSAENLAHVAENLRRLRSSDSTKSEAVEKIMEKAVATAGTLEQVRARYQAISRALTTYAPELREAQRISAEAASAAGPAVRRRDVARAANEEARWRTVSFDEAARNEALEDYHRTARDYLAAAAQVADAKAMLSAAISKRDTAGDKAKADIGGTLSGSPLNDTVGDYLSAAWQAVSPVLCGVLEFLWKHIDEIALVLDVLLVVLALTGVGGPVAVAILAVSKAARIANALSRVKQAIQLVDAVRTGNWSFVVGVGVSQVIGKGAGKLVSAKVSGWVTASAARRSLTITRKTVAQANGLLKATVTNGNPPVTIWRNRDVRLPAYHPASATVTKMLSGRNEIAAAVAPKVNGALSLMKGGDYAHVQKYVEQLNRLSGPLNSTISDAMQRQIAELAGESSEALPEYLASKVAEEVAPSTKPDGLCDTLRRIGVTK